jgi:hypothetical protein
MKMLKLTGLVLVVMFLAAAPLYAQEGPGSVVLSGAAVGAGLGAAFTIIGAGYGFGRSARRRWKEWPGSRKPPAESRRP